MEPCATTHQKAEKGVTLNILVSGIKGEKMPSVMWYSHLSDVVMKKF